MNSESSRKLESHSFNESQVVFCKQHTAWVQRWPKLLTGRYAVIENVNDPPLPAVDLFKLVQLIVNQMTLIAVNHEVINEIACRLFFA